MDDGTESFVFPSQRPQPHQIGSVYFNGYIINLSNADIGAILLLNGQPTVNLQMSYTTAKTLSASLDQAIQSLEKLMDREIMKNTEIAEKMNQDINDGQ